MVIKLFIRLQIYLILYNHFLIKSDNEKICFESENCAKLWTRKLNSVMDVLIETQSVLDVYFKYIQYLIAIN
jgi:hypothetical protein